jgi:hypothetical protein
MLGLLEKPAGEIPRPAERIVGAPDEQQQAVGVDDERARGRLGVRVRDEAAGRAFDPLVLVAELGRTARAVVPTVHSAHPGTIELVPRHVPATQHELNRCSLLAELPGELLMKLAGRMSREDIASGQAPVVEGEPGERFYIVLSGMLVVSQESMGARRVLRPGDYFGEVALTMDIPRTASIRALTPSVVASCDRETFDEFVRPLFADDA